MMNGPSNRDDRGCPEVKLFGKYSETQQSSSTEEAQPKSYEKPHRKMFAIDDTGIGVNR